MAVAHHMAWARGRVAQALAQGPSRRVVAVLIGSTDLVAAVDGRTAGLTSEADRALLRAWRESADALFVGTGTLMTELYSGSIVSDEGRRTRVANGMSALPPIVTVDRSGAIDLDVALRGADPPPLIVYVGVGEAREDDRATWVEVSDFSVTRVIDDVHDRLGARVIVAEGGPRLLRSAFAAGAVTDLSLTTAPLVVGSGLRLEIGMPSPRVELLPAEVIDGYVFEHWLLDPTGSAGANNP